MPQRGILSRWRCRFRIDEGQRSEAHDTFSNVGRVPRWADTGAARVVIQGEDLMQSKRGQPWIG